MRQEEERFESVTLLRHTFIGFLSSSYVILTSTLSRLSSQWPGTPGNRDRIRPLRWVLWDVFLLLLVFYSARYNLLFKQLYCNFVWLFFCATYTIGFLSDDLNSWFMQAARRPAVYYTLFIISYIILYYCTLLSMSRVIYTTIPDAVCTYTTCSTNLWHFSYMFRL